MLDADMSLVTDFLHSPVMHRLPNRANISRLSRNRPPQFNEQNCGYARNCGYNCGYGCEKEKGGGAESDQETAVGEASDTEGQNEDNRESEDLSASQASLLSCSTVVSGSTGLQLSSSQEEAVDGMSEVVEPNSPGDRSPVSPNGSTRSLSPIAWIIPSSVASPLPKTYHFSRTPLWLTPQCEDCRGDPASYLVVPDRSRLSYNMMEQLSREYAPAYRNVSPPAC